MKRTFIEHHAGFTTHHQDLSKLPESDVLLRPTQTGGVDEPSERCTRGPPSTGPSAPPIRWSACAPSTNAARRTNSRAIVDLPLPGNPISSTLREFVTTAASSRTG